MANMKIPGRAGDVDFIKATGSGTDADPYILQTGSGGGAAGQVQIFDGATNNVEVQTAGADATSNTTNRLKTSAHLGVFNGTTWDRIRAGLVGVQTTFVGILNVLSMGRYNATPPTLADGNIALHQLDAAGRLITLPGLTVSKASVTPTISTSPAYSINDAVGGKMSFANAVPYAGYQGMIASLLMIDAQKLNAPVDVYFFNDDPTSTTFTDNAAWDLNSADYDKLIGVAHLTDFSNQNAASTAQAINLNLPFKAVGTTIYAVAVARTTPTMTSTTGLKFILRTM